MTDAERVVELRKALRFALICWGQNDIEGLSLLFSGKDRLLSMAEELRGTIENTDAESYLKKALSL